MSETIDPVLVLRFKISPSDLDRIIRDSGYAPTSSTHTRNPLDRFNDPTYLRIGNDDELHQRTDEDGNEFTLRVNKEHSIAVFRHEGPYRYKRRNP